jgi:hypothetical protein
MLDIGVVSESVISLSFNAVMILIFFLTSE